MFNKLILLFEFMKEKIAEFIGIMLGDGSIGIYNYKKGDKIKKYHVVKVTLDSRNKEYTNYVLKLIEDVLDTLPKINYKKRENTVDLRVFKKEKVLFVLNNISLKLSPKKNNMVIPKKYFKKELFPSLLRGLFDTDGCLSIFNNNGITYPRIEIKICPSPAQEQFIKILKELGFNYKVQKLDKNWIRLRISGENELKKWFALVGSSNPIHLKKANIFLEKKVL